MFSDGTLRYIIKILVCRVVVNISERDLPIGFFDSGLGGLSVLSEASVLLPQESFIYFGDSAHAPYGTKTVSEVRVLSIKAAEFLAQKGIKALVVACNTATSVAIGDLRSKFPFPVIGMEPALKPAVELCVTGKIVVMATPLTLKENKFQKLFEKYRDWGAIEPLACPGLAELIEQGHYQGKEVEDYLYNLFSNIEHQEEVAAVVLGCTHYVFLKKEVQKLMPGAVVIDGNRGTICQLRRVLAGENLLSCRKLGERKIEFFNSAKSEPYNSLSRELFMFQIQGLA